LQVTSFLPPKNYSAGLRQKKKMTAGRSPSGVGAILLTEFSLNGQQALVYNRRNGQYLRTKSQVELTAFVFE
jgi:hypothetical protein